MHAIDANTVLDKVDTAGSSEQYFKSAGQMQELFKSYAAAVSNSLRITEKCNFEFQLGKPVFPSVELPEDETGFSWLWQHPCNSTPVGTIMWADGRA